MARESILLSVALLFFLGTAATACFQQHQQHWWHQHRRSSNSSSKTKRRSVGNHDHDDGDEKEDPSSSSNDVFQVTGLQRFAVKGLSPDPLETVELTSSTFPDDRRYALWKTAKKEKPEESWKEDTWMHKENFVCAFTHPKALAQFETSYNRQDDNLTLRDRVTGRLRLGPIALATETGRTQLAEFVTQETGVPVQCVPMEIFILVTHRVPPNTKQCNNPMEMTKLGVCIWCCNPQSTHWPTRLVYHSMQHDSDPTLSCSQQPHPPPPVLLLLRKHSHPFKN
jgi:hypothetical protein